MPASASKRFAGRERLDRIPAAVYIPTPHDVVAKMLELAAVRRDDIVYDLGCGDGRIVVAAAKTFGCRAVGIDIDPNRVKESQETARRSGVDNLVEFECRDVFQANLRPASVVTLYLSTRLNTKLIPQLKMLKPGSRIVSHQFGIQGCKPDKVVAFVSRDDGREHVLYLWTTPLPNGIH